jgi:hypothetical protein
VVVQVIAFLLDDNLEAVLGACSPPFYELVGTNCVCMYKVVLLRVGHGIYFILLIYKVYSDAISTAVEWNFVLFTYDVLDLFIIRFLTMFFQL